METFQIKLGLDMQKDVTMKEPVAALYKGLLFLNDMVAAGEAHIPTWSEQGLAALAETKKEQKMSNG